MNEVRSYVLKICFGYFLEDHECFVANGKKLQRKKLQLWCKVWGSNKRHTPVGELQTKFEERWLFCESCTGQDWIWTWCILERKAAVAKLGVYFFLLSLNSITKKITAIHDISFVFMHMGWLAWIAVMLRLRRQIVLTVIWVQAFAVAMGICGCKHTSYRGAQILHL